MRDCKRSQGLIADKSNTFVIVNKADYETKMQVMLSDPSKFRKIDTDPTENIKKKWNEIIEMLNTDKIECGLKKLVGKFNPGYAYGNYKVHKNPINPPLRLIISQITNRTYCVAKQIDKIIKPYMPNKFMISSTNEFVELIRDTQPGALGSQKLVQFGCSQRK